MIVTVVTQSYSYARLLASHLSKHLGANASVRRQLPEVSAARISRVGVLVAEYPVLDRGGMALRGIQHLLATFRTLVIGARGRDDIMTLICAGLRGCVSAESDEDTVTEAVRAIADGRRWFDALAIRPALAQLAASLGPRFLDGAASLGLSVRDGCVLQLLADGAGCSAVADVLCTCKGTAYNILCSLYHKLGVRHREAAVVEARRRGLIRDDLTIFEKS